MKYDHSYEAARARREYIRELGFDPDQLTVEEQLELLEIDARLRFATERPRVLIAR